MSSSAAQYFQNSQYYQQFPQYGQTYIPMVNVPTSNRIPTHGELVTSVDILIAHIRQFSTRLERIESRVNDWVNLGLAERMNIAETDINKIKISHNEQYLERGYINNDIDYIHDLIKDTNERLRNNEKALDQLEDVTSKNKSMVKHVKKHSQDLSKKYAEVAILRRRVSKLEDFNTEFIECFETPTQLRGIFEDISSQMEECDRTVTNIVKGGCGICSYDSCNNYKQDNEMDEISYNKKCELEDWKNVEEYFKNYEDYDYGFTESNEIKRIEKVEKSEESDKCEYVEEDEFEKL